MGKTLIKKLITDRSKTVFFLWIVFLLGFTALHFYSKYDYMLYRIAASYARVREGRAFNDGCDQRRTLMELPLKHIKQAKGVFVLYPQIKDQDIANIASIGFLNYYLYPIPVYYREEAAIRNCDYLIARNSLLGGAESFLRRQDEMGNFTEIARNDKYVLMRRQE